MRAQPRPHRPIHALDVSRFPNVVDAAFSWDRSQEARTYLRVAASRIGRLPRSVAELACGSGPLARLWASCGLDTYGLDRSATAILRARELSRGRISGERWITGDLRSFRLPRRVELAVVPLDSLGYLVRKKDLLSFFRAARRSLTANGVLAVDLTLHPEGGPPLSIQNEWEVSLLPRGSLTVVWRSRGRPWGSPVRQWEVGEFTVRVPGQQRQVFWESCPHATLSAPELEGLAQTAGGFGEMWAYSDAAHRAQGVRIHRVSLRKRIEGPRLVCWSGTVSRTD
jgi:SAM-dependent methyltransferase